MNPALHPSNADSDSYILRIVSVPGFRPSPNVGLLALESMNTELAERDGLAAQVVAEPLPTENDCRPRPELKVKSAGSVFPIPERNWARTYPSKGVIQQMQ